MSKKDLPLYVPRDSEEQVEKARAKQYGLTLEEWRAFRAPINAQIEARRDHKERVTREAIAAFQAGDVERYEALLGIRQPSALQKIASKIRHLWKAS